MNRTAIITGARHRIGRALCEALLQAGWRVIAHVRSNDDEVADGAVKIAADLRDEDAASRIIAAAGGPVDLLVNNAARFAPDSLDDFSVAEFDAHMAINLKAPLQLTRAFAAAHDEGRDAAIINILDSKLAAPNPDFLSYTLAKAGLASLTEITARALAPRGIRVNAISPALMLQSFGQDDAGFEKVHAHNPLGRGVEPADLVDAVLYLANAKALTGQTITIDGGQRFMALPRDVQFLET